MLFQKIEKTTNCKYLYYNIQNQPICLSMRIRISKRLFSNINTKTISCVSCKNYNNDNKTCNLFFDYDKITGDKIYNLAKTVRNDDNKCGSEKMIGYEPITNTLLERYDRITYKYNVYQYSSSVSYLLSVPLFFTPFCSVELLYVPGEFCIDAIIMLLYGSYASSCKNDLKTKKDKLKIRIDAIQNISN